MAQLLGWIFWSNVLYKALVWFSDHKIKKNPANVLFLITRRQQVYSFIACRFINIPKNLITNQDVSQCFGRRLLHHTKLVLSYCSCPLRGFFFSSLLVSKECHGITSPSLSFWFVIHLQSNWTMAKGIVCFLIYKWPPLWRIVVILDVLLLHYQLYPEITQFTLSHLCWLMIIRIISENLTFNYQPSLSINGNFMRPIIFIKRKYYEINTLLYLQFVQCFFANLRDDLFKTPANAYMEGGILTGKDII